MTGLTVKFIDNVAALEERREYPDAPVPGVSGRLRFVVQPSGAKSWIVRYRHDGKSQKMTLGSYPTIGLADARKRSHAALVAVAGGTNPHADKVADRRERAMPPTDLLPDVIEEFLRRHVKPNYRTAVEAERVLRKEVAAPWAARRLQEITGRDIVKLLDGIVDRGSPYTAIRTWELIRKMMRWAKSRKMIEVNPGADMEAPATKTSRDRVLSHDEIRWLWRATEAIDFPFGPLVRLLLITGQRRDEVAGMRRTEIASGVWTLPKDRVKNAKEHVVPLPSLAQKIIASLPTIGRTTLVFPAGRTGAGSERSVSGFSKVKTRVDKLMQTYAREEAVARGEELETVEIPEWRLHDLRRTMASEMARLGQPIHIVEAVLNHKSGVIRGVAAVYNRYDYRDEKQRALEAWARSLEQLVGDRPADNVVALRG